MLGGPDSFADGKYDRTPVGELLPVYLNRPAPVGPASTETGVSPGPHPRGLAPALGPDCGRPRTRNSKRLAAMPPFQTLSQVGKHQAGGRGPRARCATPPARPLPALVAQQFGKGHVGGPADRRPLALGPAARGPGGERPRALVAADRPLARRRRPRPGRGLRPRPRPTRRRRPSSSPSGCATPSTGRSTTPRSRSRSPCPAATTSTLDAEPDGREAGTYAATYVTKQPGAYRVRRDRDRPRRQRRRRARGRLGRPARRRRVRPPRARPRVPRDDRRQDRGELVDGDRSTRSSPASPRESAPITEPWTSPLWHQPLYFLIAIACLTAEWGLRRVNGLA